MNKIGKKRLISVGLFKIKDHLKYLQGAVKSCRCPMLLYIFYFF